MRTLITSAKPTQGLVEPRLRAGHVWATCGHLCSSRFQLGGRPHSPGPFILERPLFKGSSGLSSSKQALLFFFFFL